MLRNGTFHLFLFHVEHQEVMHILKKMNRSLGIALFIMAWELVSTSSTNPALPNMSGIIKKLFLILQSGKTYTHMMSSLKIVLIGIASAILFGIIFAILMSMFAPIRLALTPLLESLRGVAALTLFPLLIATLGIGDISRIFVIFWTAWPSVLISTMKGLDTERELVEAAQNCGASKFQEYRYVRIPLAVPTIVNGIRIGISGGFISLIAAEMLGATKGIGYMLLWSSHAFDFKSVYAYIIIIAVMGGLINWFMLIVERILKEKIYA